VNCRASAPFFARPREDRFRLLTWDEAPQALGMRDGPKNRTFPAAPPSTWQATSVNSFRGRLPGQRSANWTRTSSPTRPGARAPASPVQVSARRRPAVRDLHVALVDRLLGTSHDLLRWRRAPGCRFVVAERGPGRRPRAKPRPARNSGAACMISPAGSAGAIWEARDPQGYNLPAFLEQTSHVHGAATERRVLFRPED
jgi:hypothetical protein